MGVFDRFEKGLERAVNGAFAKAFRSEVQPVEIASALRRAADERAAVVGRGRTLVPNAFVVELGSTDHDRLYDYADALSDEFAANLRAHAEQQGYAFVGPVTVEFEEVPDLDTGVFRVRSATVKGRQVERGPAPAPIPRDPETPAPHVLAAQREAQARRQERSATAAIAEQKPSRRPWLDIDGHAYPLVASTTVIGRGDEADVVLDDPGVSRRHAEIRVTADGPHLVATLRDLGSTNGTFVDAERVGSRQLVEGAAITVGRTRAVYRSGER
ncbi:antibiotic biosynthesis regulator FhaA [Angustibacter peucedani]